MWRSFLWQLSVVLLIPMAAGAQVDNSTPSSQSPSNRPADGAAPGGASQAPINPEITVTGKAPHEPPLPALPPHEFTNCMQQNGINAQQQNGVVAIDPRIMLICTAKLDWERHMVIDKCINSDGKSTPLTVIQACTESLDYKILQGSYQFYVFVNRAEAYFAQGDKERGRISPVVQPSEILAIRPMQSAIL